MDRVASGMKQLNSKVLARPTVRAQPDRRAIPLASSEDLGRMLRRNREATAAFRRGTPTRTSPVSRRRQLEGLAGLGLFAVGASDKAKAADAGLKVDSGLSNFVRASPESEEMPAVSTLRSARRSLKGMRAALRQRQFERDRYLKGAPATIVATGSHVLAGFGAGCMSTIVLHPIDTVKTRLQKGADNITDAIAQGNLYNGIISNLMKEAPNSAIYMTVVEAIQNVLLTAIPNAKLLALFLAGGLGDLIGSICRVPAEMLNKRLQTGMSPDIFDAIQKTFFTEEGRQLTKETWGVVVMRDVPHGAVQYMIFLGAHAPIAALLAAILPALNDAANGGSGNFILDAVPGAVAGAIAAYGTTPADVMVTNFATYQSAELAKDAELEVEPVDTLEEEHTETTPVKDGVDTHVEGERPSLARIGAEIYKKEGIQGFFVGGLQRIVYYGRKDYKPLGRTTLNAFFSFRPDDWSFLRAI